ncbi:MAG TPA: hypothetical protein VHE12_03875 [bacterium]|nr:hypothetical protein [bacterium]
MSGRLFLVVLFMLCFGFGNSQVKSVFPGYRNILWGVTYKESGLKTTMPDKKETDMFGNESMPDHFGSGVDSLLLSKALGIAEDSDTHMPKELLKDTNFTHYGEIHEDVDFVFYRDMFALAAFVINTSSYDVFKKELSQKYAYKEKWTYEDAEVELYGNDITEVRLIDDGSNYCTVLYDSPKVMREIRKDLDNSYKSEDLQKESEKKRREKVDIKKIE